MKALILALLLTLSSCDTLDELNQIAVPIDTAAQIAGSIQTILLEADLNDDGSIQGTTEWLQFVLGIYEVVFGQEWSDG